MFAYGSDHGEPQVPERDLRMFFVPGYTLILLGSATLVLFIVSPIAADSVRDVSGGGICRFLPLVFIEACGKNRPLNAEYLLSTPLRHLIERH